MTYGTNAPNGFQPMYTLDGSKLEQNIAYFPIASAYGTTIAKGDPVTLLADGTIGIGVAGAAIIGIFDGVKYDTPTDRVNSTYWPASTVLKTGTRASAAVYVAKNVVYSVQETNGSGAAGTPLALADVNLNINFAIGTPNTQLGISGASINNTTEDTTPTLNCKILKLDPLPGNVVGSFANWLVVINNHIFSTGTGTAGV